jgi:hypothetical protein
VCAPPPPLSASARSPPWHETFVFVDILQFNFAHHGFSDGDSGSDGDGDSKSESDSDGDESTGVLP